MDSHDHLERDLRDCLQPSTSTYAGDWKPVINVGGLPSSDACKVRESLFLSQR